MVLLITSTEHHAECGKDLYGGQSTKTLGTKSQALSDIRYSNGQHKRTKIKTYPQISGVCLCV